MRVLIVNDSGDTKHIREALKNAGASIGCICPVDTVTIDNVLRHLDQAVHGRHAEYDVVVIELADRTLAERIAYAVVDRVPWQTVVMVGNGPLSDPTYMVSFAPNILGVIAEMKRMRLIM